jgi:hypothetical protein
MFGACEEAKPKPSGMVFSASYFFNLEQNDFKKLYRAKAPRAQSKTFFYSSELGVPFDSAQDMLCAFARAISVPILQSKKQPKFQICLASYVSGSIAQLFVYKIA